MTAKSDCATGTAIPSGVEKLRFLQDPVTDQLLRVAMELGAALWVERRRSRILESVLVERGVIEREELEQWVNSEDDSAAEQEALNHWMKRIFGALGNVQGRGEAGQ